MTPPSVEVVTGKVLEQESQRAVKDIMNIANQFLLTFALIALFVGSFSIYNTFSILIVQRTRDLALLRPPAPAAVSAWSVLVEAVVVGLIAAALGLVAGISGCRAQGPADRLRPGHPRCRHRGHHQNGGCLAADRPAGQRDRPCAGPPGVQGATHRRPAGSAHDRSGRSRRRLVIGLVVTAAGAASLLLGLLSQSDRASRRSGGAA